MNHVSHKRGRSFVFLFQSQKVIWYLIRTMSLNCLQVNWMMNRSANVDVEFCESGYLFAFKQKMSWSINLYWKFLCKNGVISSIFNWNVWTTTSIYERSEWTSILQFCLEPNYFQEVLKRFVALGKAISYIEIWNAINFLALPTR